MTRNDTRHLSPVPGGDTMNSTEPSGAGWVRIGALAAASAIILGGGAIAFDTVGASASKLAFASGSSSQKARPGAEMMIRLPDRFVPASSLVDPGVTSMDAVTLVGPDDPSAVSAALANEFGIIDTPTSQSPGTWNVTTTDGASFYASINEGVYSFSYNAASPTPVTTSDRVAGGTATSVTNTPPSSAAAPVPQTIIDAADHLAKSIDPGLAFGTPTTSSDGGTWSVTVPVVAGSTPTDQSLGFSYDPTTSALTGASGIVGSFGTSATYQLRSMSDALAALPTASNPGFTYGGPGSGIVAPATSGTTIGAGATSAPASTGASGPNPTPADGSGGSTTPSPDQIVVPLDAVALTLSTHQTTDGTVWLVPTYSFTSSSTQWSGPWTTIAVSPNDITIAPTVLPMGAR